MMAGLPATVVAMIFSVKKENRSSVADFFGGVAIVTFLTGITEPIEYSFVFISPLLLFIHAIYTAFFNAIVIAMHIHVGFGFSAGFIDYCISIPQSWGFSVHEGVVNEKIFQILSNPLWILVFCIFAFIIYYFTFYFLIKKMDIKTPGREEDFVIGNLGENLTDSIEKNDNNKTNLKKDKYYKKAEIIIDAIGIDNINEIDNCATRLRLKVNDSSIIDENKIKSSGAFGTKKLTKHDVQIVIGVDVEHIVDAMQKIIKK